MSVVLFILSLVVGWIVFQKYRSMFGVIYFGHKRMFFDYVIACFIVYLILALLFALLVVVLKSLLIGAVIAGIVFLVIFILEKLLGDKMPFGIKDRAVHFGLIGVCILSAIGYGVYFFTNDDEEINQSVTTEVETQDSGSDIITIGSNNYFDEVKESDEQDTSLGKYTGVEFVTQYNDVTEINVMTENRLLVKVGDTYSIYDGDFNELQSVGNIAIEEMTNEYIFYSQQLFQDGSFIKGYGILNQDGDVVEAPVPGNEYSEIKAKYQTFTQNSSNGASSVDTLYDPNTGLVGLQLTHKSEDGYIIEQELLVQPVYSAIQINNSTQQEYAFKSTDGKWGILNANGDIILEPKYSSIEYNSAIWDSSDPYFIIYNDKGEKGIFTHNGWLFEPQIPYENQMQTLNEYVMVADGFNTTVYNEVGAVVKKLDGVYQFTEVKPLGEGAFDNFYAVCDTFGECGIMDMEFEWIFESATGSNVYVLENGIFVSISNSIHEKKLRFLNEDGSLIEELSIVISPSISDGFFGVSQGGEVFIFGNTVYKFKLNPNYEGNSELVKKEEPANMAIEEEFTFDTAIDYAKKQYGEDEDTIYSIEDGIFYDENNGLGYCVISLNSKSMQEAGGSGFLLRVTVYEDGRIVEQ